ncbi:MAG: four-helix bundle copper-binding protein [Candidatus Omnitrophica bacterium]|nr:four-helix bundle copper-binding protein [Candidatus Omnitrophota bacterium]
MNRRELLASAGGIAVASMGGVAFAGENMEGHKHIKTVNKNTDLVKSANECVVTAEICLNSCIEVLATGDKSMAACAEEVIELSSVCTALEKSAAHDSKYLKQLAAVARQVCLSCEEECLKHKEYQQCLDCAKACKECAEICKKYA